MAEKPKTRERQKREIVLVIDELEKRVAPPL